MRRLWAQSLWEETLSPRVASALPTQSLGSPQRGHPCPALLGPVKQCRPSRGLLEA